jgi:hypothetical protein
LPRDFIVLNYRSPAYSSKGIFCLKPQGARQAADCLALQLLHW